MSKPLERPANTWDILILSVHQRREELNGLLDDLKRQTAPYGDVGIIVLADDISYEVGKKRTALVNLSNAQYISFIDDDDTVAQDFVDLIHPYLDGMNDYVGFKMAYYQNGVLADKPIFHDASLEGWDEDDDGWYRHIAHVNPIKREIARKFPFEGMAREDYHWSMKVKDSGLVHKSVFLNEYLYHYRRDDKKTLTGAYR